MKKIANISRFESLQTHANRSMGMQSEMSVFNFGDEEAMIENDEDGGDEDEEDYGWGEPRDEWDDEEQKELQDEFRCHTYKDFLDKCGERYLVRGMGNRWGSEKMEMISGRLDEDDEIFVWFLIQDPDFVQEHTYEPLFWDEELGEYVLGVTNFGTPYSGVPAPQLK